jgi:hypothetical protein
VITKIVRENKIVSIFVFVISVHFLIFNLKIWDPVAANHTDGGENLVSAITLYKYNTFSINMEPHAGYKREPLYPFLISLIMRVSEVFSPEIWKDVIRDYGSSAVNRMKFINFALLLITALLSFIVVYKLTNKAILGLLNFAFIIYSGCYIASMHQFLTEVPAALLILLVSTPFLFHWKKATVKVYFVWGGFFALLILTKAAFLHLVIPICFYFLLVLGRSKDSLRRIAFFLTPLLILVGGWMLRTYVQVGTFELAGRKDEFIYIRSEYNQMTDQEHKFAYVAWTPGLKKYFLDEAGSDQWSRLISRRGNDEVLLKAYDHMMERVKGVTVEPHGSIAPHLSEMLTKEAFERIGSNWTGHFKMMFSFFYRSLFINDGTGLEYFGIKVSREPDYDARGDWLAYNILANIPYWICFFGILVYFCLKKKWEKIGFFLPTLYLLFALCAIGFSHHRYVQPLVPILMIAFVYSIDLFVKGLKPIKII